MTDELPRYLKIQFRPRIHHLEFFTKRLSEGLFSGSYRSPRKRRGIEFEDYRYFTSGDDARLIDWKVSKRAGRLLVRQFVQTQNLNVYLVVDVSNSMIYTSTDTLKCEYAAELTASLAHYFLSEGDAVGLILHTDKIVKFLAPKSGQKQFFYITKTLSNPQHYGGNYTFGSGAHFAATRLLGQGLVFFISDFIGLEQNWGRPLARVAERADIIGVMVRDPQDIKLGAKIGNAIVSDPFSEKIMAIDIDLARADYAREAQSQITKIRDTFYKHNSEILSLQTDTSFARPLVDFFAARKRRWI